MKKKSMIAVALITAFTFSMCSEAKINETNQVKEETTVKAEATETKKDEGEASCMMPIAPGDSAKYLSKQLEVKGDVEFPLTLTVDSLKKMKVSTIENFKVVCQSGANMKETKSCKGILLKDILDKAKIIQKNHKDRNFYIVARATDGYKATFSWAEIFNNAIGENTYVIFEEDGKPIKVQGDFILICTNDIKTGPRHVYWLKSIEINRVD